MKEPAADCDERHTPSSLMASISEAFVSTSAQQRPLSLKGLFHDKRRGSHKGYYYDRLKDPVSGQVVTIRVPAALKPRLEDGALYLLRGILDKDVRHDGVIEPIFAVMELVEALELATDAAAAQRTEVLRQKQALGFRDVAGLLKACLEGGERPHIAFICGATSTALEDLTRGLAPAVTAYRLTERRTNLLRRQAIIDALRLNGRGGQFDALAVIRGSGVSVDLLDDVEIARAALGVEMPLLAAISHEQRKPTLLEQVADQSFAGPAALGAYLRELAAVTMSAVSAGVAMDAGDAAILAEEATLRAQAVADVEQRYRARLRNTQVAFVITTLLLLLLLVAVILQ